MVERRSYDAWGKRRNQNGTAMSNAFVTSEVRHSFTGHEDLGELGLIHMNGRLYDPAIGRFLSADPHIQYVDDMQNYNRYSYINNNPLSATDPSGYFFKSIFKGLKKLFKNKVFRIVGQVLATVYGGPQGAALFSAASTYAQTGSLTDALTAGVKTYITAQAFNQIGPPGVDGFDVANIAANAAVGCVTSAASGGKCGAGALSAGFSAAVGNSGLFKNSWGPVANAMARAVVGGTASVLGGGKFENGAATGAFTYLYLYGRQVYSDRLNDLAIKEQLNGGERIAAEFSLAVDENLCVKAEISICAGPGSIRAIGTRAAFVISETLAGSGNFTSRFVLTVDELLDTGMSFLGKGYREIGKPGSGVYRSADGLRQFRIDNSSIAGGHSPNVPHGHLETYAPGGVRPISNNHIQFVE